MAMSRGEGGGVSVVMPTNAELGVTIRRLRRARHLTIEGLAHDAGMHPTYLSGIERGVRNPSWEKVTGLCLAMDVPIIELARDAEDEARLAARMRIARSELGLDGRAE
jgi:transcriptional regulator with XRE-family HTH domain